MDWELKAGEVLTKAKMDKRTPITKIKTAPQTISSSITLVDDNHLFAEVEANAVYRVILNLKMYGPTAGDLRVSWSVPSGTSAGSRHCFGAATGVSSARDTLIRATRNNWTDVVPYGTDTASTTARNHVYEDNLLKTGGSAGTLQLRWAQNSSSASTTTVADGMLVVRRLA